MKRLPAIVLALLVACGGDGDRSSTIEKFPVSELSGLVVSGFEGQRLPPVGDLVRAARGELDFRDGRTDAAGRYALSVTQFPAPYLVVADGSSLRAMSLDAGSTTVNVSPLSDLLMMRAAFDAGVDLGPVGVQSITEAHLASAMRRVQDHLLLNWQVRVPADWRSIMARPARAEAGDPLFDALQALNAAWAAQGVPGYHFDARLRYDAELRRCAAEQVLLALGTRETAFCPLDRESSVGTDGTVEDRFFNPAGERLVLRSTGGRVNVIEFTGTDAQAWRCDGGACAGASLATADDGTRRVVLTDVVLQRAGQPAGRAAGRVTALPAGTPRLPCAIDYVAVGLGGASPQGDCMLGFSVPAAGEETASIASATGQTGLALEVRHDGTRVRAVVLTGVAGQPDEVLGYRCTGVACGGLSVETTAQGQRQVQAAALVLQGVDGTGNAVPGARVTLALSLRVDPPAAGWAQPDCSGLSPTAAGQVAGGRSFVLCPSPVDELADLQGFTLDPTTATRVYLFRHVSQGLEMNASLSVEAERVVYLNVALDEGAGFWCFGDECAGRVRIGAPNLEGRRRVEFDAVQLSERDVLNLPTGRTLTLRGQLLTVGSRCLDQDPCFQ